MNKKKKTFALIVCIVVALVSTVLLFAMSKGTETEYSDVVVLKELMIRGDQFLETNLDTVQMPKNQVTSNMVTDKNELINKYATRDVDPAIPVLKSAVGESLAIRNVSEGMTKVNVPVEEYTQGGVVPGDRINILEVSKSAIEKARVTVPAQATVLARNVKVLGLLYESGSERDEKEVKEAQSGGGKVTVTESGSGGMASSGGNKYPTMVVVEVDFNTSKAIYEAINNEMTLAMEYDPWSYDKIQTIKDAIDKSTQKTVSLAKDTTKKFADVQKEYAKLSDLGQLLTVENGGVNGEKEFFNKYVRSMIEINKTIKPADAVETKFVVDELNKWALTLSELNVGWWTIEDEMDSIKQYVESKGGVFTVYPHSQFQVTNPPETETKDVTQTEKTQTTDQK